MTRFFAIAATLLLAAGFARAQEVALGDQCVAVDKNDNLISDFVDDKGNQISLCVKPDGKVEEGCNKRDPAASAECAYLLCGTRTNMNKVTACKTGRKEPPSTRFGILPSFLFPKENMKVDTPAAGIGIRG